MGDAEIPQIAFDGSGNAIAVWRRSDGAQYDIWANRFNGTSWGEEAVKIETAAGDAYIPQIAFDSSGNAIAVWYQHDGTRNSIYANRFNGTSWGTTAELIETGNAGNAETPQIAFDVSGNAIAVWQQNDGTQVNIYANHFE